jgi:WW domain-containing oxidoreductase
MSLIARIKGVGPNGFGWSTTAEEVVKSLDLSQRTILITGCNSGIGFEIMRVLATRGATVYGSARTRKKAEDAVARVGKSAIPIVCELSDPPSILRCVNAVRVFEGKLDAIICNAGIMALPELERVYGYEKQFFVNYVGHYILVMGLLDELADNGRVVMVSSDAHKYAPPGGIEFDNLEGDKGYNPWRAYGQSKLANILFARELARQFELQGTHRKALAVHPGSIETNLTRYMPSEIGRAHV